MQNNIQPDVMELATLAARAGGQVLLDRFQTRRAIHSKGFRDIVTDADVAAQEAIVTVLRQHFPEHGLLSEEGLSANQGCEWLWVIDPLDGTVNYSRRLPCFAVSVALVVQGEPMVGVVFDPVREQLFAAGRGAGATLNGELLHVSARHTLEAAVIGFDWARDPLRRSHLLACLNRVAPACGTMRAVGSAVLALCYVATGALDGYFHLAIQPWDGAAASLIVREAGGLLTDLSGAEWRYTTPACVASNGLIHAAILERLYPAQS